MTKKQFITLTVAFVAVVGFYYYLFGGRFRRADIQISHTFRPSRAALFGRPAAATDIGNENLNFGLNGEYRLTSVKIVSDAEFKTNKYAHPVWELTTTSNSAPTRVFGYGMRIKGMHPAVKGAAPGALEANVSYVLLVEAGSIKGEHIFTIPETANPTPEPQ